MEYQTRNNVQETGNFYYQGVPQTVGIQKNSNDFNVNIIFVVCAICIVLGIAIICLKKRKEK